MLCTGPLFNVSALYDTLYSCLTLGPHFTIAPSPPLYPPIVMPTISSKATLLPTQTSLPTVFTNSHHGRDTHVMYHDLRQAIGIARGNGKGGDSAASGDSLKGKLGKL